MSLPLDIYYLTKQAITTIREKTVMLLVLSLIVVIACFVVSVILNTLVREKTRDIGIMRSMGFSSFNIMKIFMIEGTILGFIGVVVLFFLSFTNETPETQMKILKRLFENTLSDYKRDIWEINEITKKD